MRTGKDEVSIGRHKLPSWYRIHVRWPTDTGAADVFFCIQAENKKEALMKGTDLVEELIPSICENNYTTWAALLPGYRPSKRTSWKHERAGSRSVVLVGS